jgi:hypothetical protein
MRKGCSNTADWEDEPPTYPVPGGSAHTNRTHPQSWVLAARNHYGGQLSQKAKGICPTCRTVSLTFTADDPVSLWSRRLDIKATEPGVFGVFREDGAPYGQIRYGLGQAMLMSQGGAQLQHLEIVAARIAERFDLT